MSSRVKPAEPAARNGALPAAQPYTTEEILEAILSAQAHIADIIFSPGRPPQAGLGGRLLPVDVAGLSALTPQDTARIASELIGNNTQAKNKLDADGSCDISYKIGRAHV